MSRVARHSESAPTIATKLFVQRRNNWNGVDFVEYHQRKTVRLQGYDYTQAGFYFVTICTQGKKKLFGNIVATANPLFERAEIILSDAGKMIEMIYNSLQTGTIILHEHVVMPNHLHGIIEIRHHNGDSNDKTSLPNVVQTFKRLSTLKYIEGVKSGILAPFDEKFWQRGHYEHVIRNETELSKIKQYIIDNPTKWADDEYYA